MRVGAKIYIGTLSGQPSVQIKATSDQGLDTGWVDANWDGDSVSMPDTDSQIPLAGAQITAYGTQGNGPFTIKWSAKIGDGAEKQIGTTTHVVYVTRGDPIKTASFGMFESVYAIGCIYADGLGDGDENDIVDCIYSNVFSTGSVRRVKAQSTEFDDTDLTYWKPGHKPDGSMTLLGTGDGTCGSWGMFFVDILRTQGIDAQFEVVAPAPPPAKSVVDADAQKNGLGVPTNGPDSSKAWLAVKQWNVPDDFHASAADGPLPAQGNNNPPKKFDNHALVSYNLKLYDPSYGAPVIAAGNAIANLQQWENGSLRGVLFDGIKIPTQTTIGGVTTTSEVEFSWLWSHEMRPAGQLKYLLFSY